jgi:hypothetical protein
MHQSTEFHVDIKESTQDLKLKLEDSAEEPRTTTLVAKTRISRILLVYCGGSLLLLID